MTIYDFGDDLAFSKGERQESDLATLRTMFPRAVSVIKTDEADDRAGTDYIVTLRRGARVKVDAKARRPGCREHWRAGPEVALEVWNVLPGGKYRTPMNSARVGWTLDESKEIDLILFTFDQADHKFAYIRPLPQLREAFRRNCCDWCRTFKTDTQTTCWDTRNWQSECVFVPLVEVDLAIDAVSRSLLAVGE